MTDGENKIYSVLERIAIMLEQQVHLMDERNHLLKVNNALAEENLGRHKVLTQMDTSIL